MRIQKIKDTFNDYRVEMSWGQLQAIYAALEQNHSDPLADEAFAELGWYLQNIPGPGEDEDEYKEAKDAEKAAIEGNGEGAMGPDGELVGQELEAPPGDGGEFQEPEGAESPVPSQTPPEPSEADSLLERPPATEGVGA